MKQSISVLAALAIIIGFIDTAAAAQTKPTSSGVVMTNAYDAFGSKKKGLKHDFGFSTVIEYKGETILFDAGTDARVFESNLKSLKIDLRKIDIAIVSHGHYDHTGGFDYLLSVNPKVKIYLPDQGKNCEMSKGLSNNSLQPMRQPARLSSVNASARGSEQQRSALRVGKIAKVR